MIVPILLILLIALAVLCVVLWKRQRRNEKKVEFLFDSIDSGDYAFFFTEKEGREQSINASLNRVREVMQHAREEQIQKEKYYEQILASIDTGVLVVDEQRGLVLQHNRAASKLLGRDVITHIQQISRQLSDFSVRESYATLKGRKVKILAFSDIHGELARQETESWVKLIRVLTHEVMNTLTPIISLSDALQEDANDTQQEGLKVIHQTSQELIHFVEAYRKATLIPQPQPTAFYLQPFLDRMAHLVDEEVTVVVKPQDLMVYADEGLISRVVSNLLKNAVQAGATSIEVHAYLDREERVLIDISNNGAPIPDDVASHIFVPFFTTKKDGSGIGLSISQQIMGLSNGTISLVHDTPHNQTTFRLTFN